MSLADLLAELRDRDILVWAEGERLRCNAPAGGLSPKLRAQLQQRKDELLNFLRAADALGRQQRAIVPMQPHGERIAVFAVPGHNGDVFAYRALARHLGDDQPFFGLQAPGLDGQSAPLDSVEELAAYFAAEIRAFRPDGPYVIAGYCAGGTIAFELARQLAEDGAAIPFIALFGSPSPGWYRLLPRLRRGFAAQAARLAQHSHALLTLSAAELRRYIAGKLAQRKAQREADRLRSGDRVLARRAKVEAATLLGVRRYTPTPSGTRIGLFLPSPTWGHSDGWRPLLRDAEEYFGPEGCSGDNMLREPQASFIAELFRQCLDRSERTQGSAEASQAIPLRRRTLPSLASDDFSAAEGRQRKQSIPYAL